MTAIPPVRIPYFDPQTGTYNVAQSKEISITVKPAGKVTAFDAELSSETNLKNRLLNSPHGIRHNNLELEFMNKAVPSPISIVLCALFIPAVLFGLFFFFTSSNRLLRKDPALYKAKKALSTYLKVSVKELSDLENATRQYFADKLNITADAHTQSELIQKLQLTENELVTLKEIYETFDLNRFNKERITTDIGSLKNKSTSFIKLIDGRIKNV